MSDHLSTTEQSVLTSRTNEPITSVIDRPNSRLIFNHHSIWYVIDVRDQVWFIAGIIVEMLEYNSLYNSPAKKIDDADRKTYRELRDNAKSCPNVYLPLHTVFISHRGLLLILFSSSTQLAKCLRKWIVDDVLLLFHPLHCVLVTRIHELTIQIQDLQSHMLEQDTRLHEQDIQLRDQSRRIRDLELALQQQLPYKAPVIASDPAQHQFFIFQKNNASDELPFCAVRIQNQKADSRRRALECAYPNGVIILKFDYSPNPIEFFHLMKERLPLSSHGVHFSIAISVTELMFQVTALHNENLSILGLPLVASNPVYRAPLMIEEV